MKTTKSLLLTLALALFATVAFTQDKITDTPHNFSAAGWNTSGEICITCHTPHNADQTVADAPLWNHEVTAQSFTPYDSPTLDAAPGQPSGASKLCLSCHDGSVALENFGLTTTGTNFIATAAEIGGSGDLTDHHPVSFTYDATLATTDTGLWDPETTNSGLGDTITNDMLFGGIVQCATCHDPHGGVTNTKLLVLSNAASGLCLTCHNK